MLVGYLPLLFFKLFPWYALRDLCIFKGAQMVLVSRRASFATFLTTVEITLTKAHVVTTWHVVTLNKTCAPGNSKLMMNSTGPGGRVKHRLSQLGRPEIILWVPWQVGYSTHLVIYEAGTCSWSVGSCLINEQRGRNESKLVCQFIGLGVDLHYPKT